MKLSRFPSSPSVQDMAHPENRGADEDVCSHTMFPLVSSGLWFILDFFVPATAKVTINIFLLVLKNVDSGRQIPSFWPVRAILLGLDVAWTFGLWIFVPIRHQLVVQRTFYKSILPFLADAFVSCRRDGPSAPSTDNRERNGYHLWLQLCWFMLLINPTWCAMVCVRVIIWIMMPLLCLALALIPLETWKRGSGTLLDPVFPRLLRKAYQVWDICQTLPAGLLEGLPNILQAKFSRWQQRRAVRRSIPIYQYTPLESGEIRLLILRRAAWLLPGTIQATLVHVPADNPGEFEAISYCWGRPKRSEEILLDGARYSITESALELLIARRSFWNDRIIWIDAICINQDDKVEKSIQLGHMRDIYYLASRVIAFPSGDYRLRLIEPLLTRCSTSSILNFHHRTGAMLFEGPESVPLQLRVLAHCLSSGYFNRAWVFQEVTVGQTVHVYLGGRYVSWSTLASALANMTPNDMQVLFGTARHAATAKGNQALFLRDSRAITHVKLMHDCRIMAGGFLCQGAMNGSGIFAELNAETGWEMGNRLAEDLELALFYTNQFEASDGRDRLFALLGIVQHDSRNPLLRPDYEKSEEQVFHDLALYLLLHNPIPSVNLLTLAGTGFTKSRKYRHSWVPNLREERPCFRLTYSRLSGYRFGTMVERDASIAKGDLPGSISVTGLIIDRIACVSSTGPLRISHIYEAGNSLQDNERMEQISVFTKSAISLVDRYKIRWPGLHKQLWRTLIAGGNKSTESFDRMLPDAFEDLLIYLDALRSPDFQGFWRTLSSHSKLQGQDFKDPKLVECISLYIESMAHVCTGRLFGITEGGRMCLLPPLVEAGSTVFVAFGAQLPFILHQRASFPRKEIYELVGEAYVEGIVRGELQFLLLEQSMVQIL